MATVKKMKKAQDGKTIIDKLAAKTAERNSKPTPLRAGQKSRLDRIAGSNVDRAIKVGKRMLQRRDARAAAPAPAMKKGGMVKKAAKKK